MIDASTEHRTFENAEVLVRAIAERICALALASERKFTICLSGGSTPRRLYEELSTPSIALRFPWKRAHWFWGDERFVSHDDPDSNYGMAYEALLSRVPVSNDNIHPIPIGGLSPSQAANAYETTLKKSYGADSLSDQRPLFDVTLLGIGEDGHTASLFPGQQSLDERTRWVIAVQSPKYDPRITLTYGPLQSSRDVMFLATGPSKQRIIARAWAGDESLPAARLRPTGRLHWILDQAATPRTGDSNGP
jgi:6-phosphogluconolactonase